MKSKIILSLLLYTIAITYILCQDEVTTQTTSDIKKKFWDSFFSGFSLIVVSEIGDKTFFLTMVYAATNSFAKTFFLTGATMLTMNAISLLIGLALPFLLYREYIDWIAIFVFLIFGLILFYQGLTMESKYIDEEYEEVVREIRSGSSSMLKDSASVEIDNKDLKEKILEKKDEEEALVVKKKLNSLPASVYVTSLIVAELGDRSQITAIVIGAINNFYGVLLGTSLAFIVCILTAIFFGNFLKRVLTNKQLTLIGAVIFLLFSFIYLMEKLQVF